MLAKKIVHPARGRETEIEDGFFGVGRFGNVGSGENLRTNLFYVVGQFDREASQTRD